jgi:hypothetical protein
MPWKYRGKGLFKNLLVFTLSSLCYEFRKVPENYTLRREYLISRASDSRKGQPQAAVCPCSDNSVCFLVIDSFAESTDWKGDLSWRKTHTSRLRFLSSLLFPIKLLPWTFQRRVSDLEAHTLTAYFVSTGWTVAESNKTKSVAFSLRANYTDWAIAACQRR